MDVAVKEEAAVMVAVAARHLRGERRDRQEDDVLLDVVPALLEEGRQLGDALVEALLRPAAGGVVHLVDDDDEDAHAQGLRQHRVLARLPSLVEARLELALPRRDHEDADVGLARARDHVGHVVLVA